MQTVNSNENNRPKLIKDCKTGLKYCKSYGLLMIDKRHERTFGTFVNLNLFVS